MEISAPSRHDLHRRGWTRNVALVGPGACCGGALVVVVTVFSAWRLRRQVAAIGAMFDACNGGE